MGTPPDLPSRFAGLLLGTALGDSVGLPMEGLTPPRQRQLFPGPLRQRLVFGRGMVSDDTDHALFVAQSLLAHPDDPERFQRRLAWCLRGWIVSLPPGVGFATLRSILLLWIGVRPGKSGVFSAGNGPAMRAPVLGAFLAVDPARLRLFVEASTILTHRDPRAFTGAWAVARTAAALMEAPADAPVSTSWLVDLIADSGEDTEWQGIVEKVEAATERRAEVADLARDLGLERGVTGYAYHTVPIALYAVWRHWGDYRATVTAVIRAGVDTDTTAAIAGALAGLLVGETRLPEGWLARLWDPPRGVALLRAVGHRLAEAKERQAPVRWLWWLLPLRHLVQLVIVLGHGFRRLAPPYA